MFLRKEQGNIVLYFTSRVYVHTVQQWTEETGQPISFDLINVYFDLDPYMDRCDFGVILFGIGLSLKINYFSD